MQEQAATTSSIAASLPSSSERSSSSAFQIEVKEGWFDLFFLQLSLYFYFFSN